MTRMKEAWKAVSSVPGLEASDLGRIRVKPYEAPMPHGGVRTYGGHAWIGTWDGNRYITRFRGKSYRIARLVCEAWHGPAPPGRTYVLHIREDARNNRPDNLRWGTQKENLNTPRFLAYCRSRTGENSTHAKATRQ